MKISASKKKINLLRLSVVTLATIAIVFASFQNVSAKKLCDDPPVIIPPPPPPPPPPTGMWTGF